MATNYIGANTLYQAGAGNIIGATSIVLTSFTDIYGNVLTMADFGSLGYITCEPDTSNQEFLTFSGVTPNANGTYTLTGIKTTLAKRPYTQTSGAIRNHAGGTKVIITDNVAFWDTFVNKNNASTVNAVVTFATGATPVITDAPVASTDASNKGYVDGIAIAGAPKSSTTVFGLVQMSTNPASAVTPIAVGDNDGRVPTQSENNALVGNNTDIAVGTGNKFVTQTGLQHGAEKYVLCASGSSTAYTGTYSPVPTSITNGMEFLLKIDVANTTTTPTFNPNGLGAKTIVKGTSTALVANDLIIGQVARFVYDGTNMVLQNPATATQYLNGTTTKNAADASGTQNIAHGLGKIPKFVTIDAMTTGLTGAGDVILVKAETVYNGTTQSSMSFYATGASFAGAGGTYAATFTLNSGGAAGTTTGVVTFDATNIIITWTKTNSPTGTYQMLWTAQG